VSEHVYPAGEAARLSGVNYPVLDYWARSGFIVPSLQQAHGKGSARAYSFTDIVALRVARQLREAGVSLQALRKVVERLREKDRLNTPLADAYLLTDGTEVYERRGDEVLALLQRPGQGCLWFVVDLAGAVNELRDATAGYWRGESASASPSESPGSVSLTETERRDLVATRRR
jgi:DNA-binding transcriptional MerR regulator